MRLITMRRDYKTNTARAVTRVGAAAASRVKVGDHVVLSFGSCSTCRFCQTGRPAACKRLFAYNFHSLRDDDTPIAWASSDNLQLGALFFSQSSWCRVALVHMSCVVPVDLSIKELRFAGAFSCGVQTGAGTILCVLSCL